MEKWFCYRRPLTACYFIGAVKRYDLYLGPLFKGASNKISNIPKTVKLRGNFFSGLELPTS